MTKHIQLAQEIAAELGIILNSETAIEWLNKMPVCKVDSELAECIYEYAEIYSRKMQRFVSGF